MHTSVSTGRFHIVDGITRLLGLALFALLPFFIIPTPWASVAQGKMLLIGVFVILIALAWLVARLLEGVVHVPRSMLLYSAVLLPLAYSLSTVVSGWSQSALVGQGVEQDTLAAAVVWFSTLALSSLLFFGNQAAIRLAIQSLVAGLSILLLFQSLFILFPSLFSLSGLLVGETANLFGSWHDLGIIAGLSLFLAFSLSASGFVIGWRRIVLALLGAAALFLVIVIHFRDIFIATSALFAVAALIVVSEGAAHTDISIARILRRAAPFLIAAALLGAGGFVGPSLWEKLPDRINVVQTEVRPSWQGTFETARESLQAPMQLFFGSGPNSFVREWGRNKPAEVNLTPFWNADFTYGVGIIPTSIFTAGLFGTAAWGVIFLILLALAGRYMREMRFRRTHTPAAEIREGSLEPRVTSLATGPEPRLTASRVICGVAMLSVAYLIGYHLMYTPSVTVTGSLFLLMGLLVAASVSDQQSRSFRIGITSVRGVAGFVIVLLFVVTSVAGAGLIGREVVSNLFVNRAAYAYQIDRDEARAGSDVAKALAISPNNDRAHRAAAELGIVRLAQLIQTAPGDDASRAALQETLQNTIQHGLVAVSINESNYQNWLLLAQVYADLAGANIEGSLDAAKNAYEKAFEASPKNPLPKLRLAQLAALSGNRAAARTYLQEAIALKGDFAAAYYLLSHVEAADGNGDAAIRAASTAVQLVQDDPVGWYNLGYMLYIGGAYEAAAQALRAALDRAPDYSNALFYFGLAAYQLGNTEVAAQALDRVSQLNPQETWVQQVSANVRAGKEPMAGMQQQ